MSAQALHPRLRDGGSTIGLATVYRALADLATDGDADSLQQDGEALYRACTTGKHHHHLICRNCGLTVEIEADPVEQWAQRRRRRARLHRRQSRRRHLRRVRRLHRRPRGRVRRVPARMHVILVPGFWLEADAWDEVVPVLREAGHSVEAVTRDGDTLDEQVAALVGTPGRRRRPRGTVVLVGHSGAGPIAYMAVDRRPSLVQHLVYVDTFPGPEGGCVNDELPVVDGVVPLPPWDFWEPATVRGMTPELRTASSTARSPNRPAVPTDPFHYADPARHRSPRPSSRARSSPPTCRPWSRTTRPGRRSSWRPRSSRSSGSTPVTGRCSRHRGTRRPDRPGGGAEADDGAVGRSRPAAVPLVFECSVGE